MPHIKDIMTFIWGCLHLEDKKNTLSLLSVNPTLIHIIAMKRFGRQICTFIILLLAVLSASGQDSYVFHHLKTENGLSNSNVKSMLKDHKGFLWIGTECHLLHSLSPCQLITSSTSFLSCFKSNYLLQVLLNFMVIVFSIGFCMHFYPHSCYQSCSHTLNADE